ncbi:MAG TPA: fibronectin type III domain-containing protein [Elusimicrobiales bacterium]|nr:fibronectin type III domain-containing protein [Elusimicrobiales bacterium]
MAELWPNTTYYFRVGSINHAGLRNYIGLGSTATLTDIPQAVSPEFLSAQTSSITAGWAALPPSPSSATAEGYTLEASSTDFDGGTVYSSTTLLSQTSALTVTGLEPNTTYYFRVGALNWNARPSYLVLPATATLAGAPPGFAVGEVFVSSAALAWDPPAGGAEGYELQASSTNFNGTGLLLSSATPDGDLTALALPDLLANTTYFFRVGALNWNGAVNFSAILATSTISGAVGAPGVSAIFLSSAAVTWAVPEQGAEGYELRASSTGFDGTGAVLFSSSTDGGLTGLEVQGLQVNTVYSFRAGSFNWNKVLNFAVAGTSSTLANVPANPVLTKVYISSVVLNWDLPAGGAGGYVVEASTVADFTGLIVSSATTDGGAGGITVISLDSETTFYFRAGALNWDGVGNFVYVGSTLTHSSTDMAAPAAVGGLAAAAYSANAALLTWSGPADATNNPLNGTYAIQYSTWTGVEWSTYNAQVIFSTSGVNPGAPQVRVVEGLDANTTYYFQLWTADTRPNWSPISNGATVATLADQVVGTEAAAVYLSSLTVNWAALPAGPSSATCQGYRLEASSVNFEGGVVYSSQTAEAGASALTLAELDSNTTYYFRVGSLNWNASPNYALTGSTSTLAKAVTPLVPVFTEVFSSAIKARWAALPAAPSSSTGEGYLLEASSSNFDGTGTVYSSATADAALNALTIEDLAANTTYYFRAGSLNWNSRPNYTALGATATLANQPQAAALAGVFLSSAALAWDLPAGGAQGYELRASSTDFNGTGLVLSSATADGALLTLTVSGLAPNTTWFFKAGSLNHNGSVNFAAALSASTLAEAPQKLAFDFTGAFVSSVTARWSALPAAPQYAAGEGYVLEASSTNFSGGVVYSSATSFVQAYTLTVSDLDANTTYYFRVGSLDWNAKANYTVLSATSTLAVAPEADEPSVTLAGVSSIAAQWLDYVNPAWTLYRLDLSTSAGFDGALLSSVTFNLVAERAGLAPNTTYYARVAAQNNNGVLSAFASLGSTITLAAQPEPVEPAFAPVYSSSLTVSFGPGSPQNPDWTVYEVQLSSYPGFDSFLSSDTAAPAAAFQDLAPNTTWYARARAYNGSGIYTGFADLFSTATLAVPPGQAESTFSDVTANEFILYWSSGQAATGYNPEGTSYLAQLSTAADFDGELIASETQELYAAFGGLYPGANYYARVQALNHQGIATGFTLYGSTVTLTSAKPVFLGGLEVSDSQGNFIPASAYTDTTTPNIRINVQSVFAPGLAVTDNPSQLALWHLEDGAGGAAKDDSDHNRGLTLYNSPAWITGKLGSALQFDGSGSYGVSPTLVPWRNSAANSPFSISLWFRTTQAKGFIFQVADSDTAGAAIYDCELSWHDVTGKLALEIARNTGGVRYIIQAPSAYTDGEWHFVAAVLNPSGMYLFVDGAQVQSGTGVNSTSSRRYPGPTYLWLGAASVEGATMGGPGGSGDPYRFFAGDIDEVSVSTVALNLAQIQELYVLSGARGLRPGAPAVELSTQSGADFTWSRTSTAAFSITGANGSTAQEVFSSSLALSGAALRQTASPGADTNQVLFMAASLDSNRTTVQFTILVDTTPPAAPSFAPLSAPTTFSLTVSGLAGEDSLSGLHAAPFKVQASTDPAFGVISEDSGFISDTGFTFTTLEPDTLYYVRALARDAAGNVSAVSSSQERATLSGLHQPPGISPSGGGVLLF